MVYILTEEDARRIFRDIFAGELGRVRRIVRDTIDRELGEVQRFVRDIRKNLIDFEIRVTDLEEGVDLLKKDVDKAVRILAKLPEAYVRRILFSKEVIEDLRKVLLKKGEEKLKEEELREVV